MWFTSIEAPSGGEDLVQSHLCARISYADVAAAIDQSCKVCACCDGMFQSAVLVSFTAVVARPSLILSLEELILPACHCRSATDVVASMHVQLITDVETGKTSVPLKDRLGNNARLPTS